MSHTFRPTREYVVNVGGLRVRLLQQLAPPGKSECYVNDLSLELLYVAECRVYKGCNYIDMTPYTEAAIRRVIEEAERYFTGYQFRPESNRTMVEERRLSSAKRELRRRGLEA